MLTQTLRELERGGLLFRTTFDEIPPHVEYGLTPLGHSLLVVVQQFCSWALAHMDEVQTARLGYDARHEEGKLLAGTA